MALKFGFFSLKFGFQYFIFGRRLGTEKHFSFMKAKARHYERWQWTSASCQLQEWPDLRQAGTWLLKLNKFSLNINQLQLIFAMRLQAQSGCTFQESVKIHILCEFSKSWNSIWNFKESMPKKKNVICGPVWTTVHQFAIWHRFRFLTQWKVLPVDFY